MTKSKSSKSKSKSGKLRARDVLIPVGTLIILVLLIVGTVTTGLQNGWKLPVIGSIGVIAQNGGNGSNGTNSTSSSGSSGGNGINVLQIGKLGLQMSLVADFSDGSNQTLSSVGSLPAFGVIGANGKPLFNVNGRGVNDVRAMGFAAITGGSNLPSGSIAEFFLNYTAFNEQTQYMKWQYIDTRVSFIAPTATTPAYALTPLPALQLLPQEAFTDHCDNLGNGTYACSQLTNSTHRVDWTISGAVNVLGPGPQFAVLSVIPQGALTSSAAFNSQVTSGDGITLCNSCGPSGSVQVLPGTFAPANGGNNNGPSSPPNGPYGANNVNMGCAGNCGPVAINGAAPNGSGGGTCLSQLPLFAACGGGVQRTSSGGGVSSGGKIGTSVGNGRISSGQAGKYIMSVVPVASLADISSPTNIGTEVLTDQYGNILQSQPIIAISGVQGVGFQPSFQPNDLIPINYVTLSLSNGTWAYINQYAVAVFAALYIAGVFGIYGLYRVYKKLLT